MTALEHGASIARRRRLMGWSQAELARRVGANRMLVSMAECGGPSTWRETMGLVLDANIRERAERNNSPARDGRKA